MQRNRIVEELAHGIHDMTSVSPLGPYSTTRLAASGKNPILASNLMRNPNFIARSE
jgi:hypothetical protein